MSIATKLYTMKHSNIIYIVLFLLPSCNEGKKEIIRIDYTIEDYPIYIAMNGINEFFYTSHDFQNPDSIFHFYN
jgi:hypothetical protein